VWLADKYVLHPSRRVAKLSEPLMLERTMEPKVLRRKVAAAVAESEGK